MKVIGAVKVRHMGDSYDSYVSQDPPRVVLDRLEKQGYHVVSTAGAGQSVV